MLAGLTRALADRRYGRKRALDVREAGAVADGATNNGPAFLAALTAAKAAKRTLPFSLGADPYGTLTIALPPGDHVITDLGGLLGQEAMTGKISGLRFVGAGKGITNVIFKPTAAGDLCVNDYWQNLQFENIAFHAATAGCTFMHSYGNNGAQRYTFINCTWNKFKYAFYLEGGNNNSEYSFYGCATNNIEATGAVMRIPSTGSDQFLNYYFFGFTHTSSDAPIIDADMGGHFKFYGCDVSNWGAGLTAPGQLFKLNGQAHALGTCSLRVDGLRCEAKNPDAGLLYSQWPYGNVTFTAVDWTSQAFAQTYNDIIYINYVNVDGPTYTFKDSYFVGGVNVAFQASDYLSRHKIVFEDCQWRQRNRPTDVVTYAGQVGNDYHKPPVEFVRCRGGSGDPFSANGAAVWDATVGYTGDLLQALTPRCVSVRTNRGMPNASSIVKVQLPVGALVTSFEALSPAGAVTEADGGTWTLATTEGSPTTVATATVAGAMSAGFDAATVLPVPFACDTDQRATLTVTPSNVTQANPGGLILIRGYW
jgi:hypothetical protein